MHWLFYDLETSGLNVAFDQILQYAAITTDSNFNISKTDTGYAKYRADVWPTPEAAITHCISKLPHGAQTEAAVVKNLHQQFNNANTISLGYNTLGFDDEFLRFAFYRNLLPPYTHQYANNCSRRDLYPITVLYYLFSDSALEWPMINGKISLKLDALSAANKLADGMAHDALVDVKATIALAKRLQTHDTKIWQFANMQFNKEYDCNRINLLKPHQDYATHKIALLVSGRFGAKNNFIRPAILLGSHKHYRNQTVWLALDNAALSTATTDNFLDNCHIINRKPCEQIFVLPFDNKYELKLQPEAKINLDKNISWLNSSASCINCISAYALDFTYPKIDNIDAYAELYQCGFADPQTAKLMREFHNSSLLKQRTLYQQLQQPYRELARRLIILNQNQLNSNEQAQLAEYLEFSSQGRIDNRGLRSDSRQQLLERANNLLDLNADQRLALQYCCTKLGNITAGAT